MRSEERIKALLLWCVHNRIHLVVDEIFALSVFPSSPAFRSMMEIATDVAETLPHKQAEKIWEHVHVIYGLSKDFCMSGALHHRKPETRSFITKYNNEIIKQKNTTFSCASHWRTCFRALPPRSVSKLD